MEIDNQLAIAIKALAAAAPPNWQRPLRAYSSFDWSRMGAHVLTSDAHGATVVCWMGHTYQRRNAAGKFGLAVWFSRSVKGDGDAAEYLRLITFKGNGGGPQVEPLSPDVARALQ